MPKSVAQRQADSRERKRKAGMKFLQVWLSKAQYKKVMAFIKSLTKQVDIMQYEIRIKRTHADYLILDIDAKDSSEAKKKAMVIAKDEPERFCDGSVTGHRLSSRMIHTVLIN